MRSPRRLAVVGVLAVVVCGLLVWRLGGSGTSEPELREAASTSLVVEPRDLAEFTTLNGEIRYAESISVSTEGTGVLVDLPGPGSTVEQGEVLYALSDEPASAEVLSAQSQVDSAEAQVASAVAQLDTMEDGANPSELAAADAAVHAAEEQLEALTTPPTPAQRATADAQVLAAQQTLDDLLALVPAATASAVAIAEANLLAAEEARADLLDGPDPTVLAQARDNLVSAQARLTELREGASPEELAAARSSVASAQTTLDVAVRAYVDLLDVSTAPVLFYGVVPMTRALGPGDQGGDVMQLQSGLVALGFGEGLVADGTYGEATTAAVAAWQGARGVPATGAIAVDDVVFQPGPLRVDAWSAGVQIGGQVGSGGGTDTATTTAGTTSTGTSASVVALAEATLVAEVTDGGGALRTTQEVVAELPVADRALATVGDPVEIRLPDGTAVEGSISQVSATTTVVAETGDEWFDLTVVLADAVEEVWVGAPIDVDVVASMAEDVLAVPVAALVTLAEGGYAVEVEGAGPATELVAVETGMFADGFVEVTGQLSAGDTVLVPA